MMDDALIADLEVTALLYEPQPGPVDPKNCVTCAALVIVLEESTEQNDKVGLMEVATRMADHAKYGHPEDTRIERLLGSLFKGNET
ncbi:hypothetical protein [Streptomyces sp. NPDC058045]|uniref:hypothetical protein n=1 Tax=Streptomyces sp. NPDC058045 TaxID=3346311 RepID=UPI0036E293CE